MTSEEEDAAILATTTPGERKYGHTEVWRQIRDLEKVVKKLRHEGNKKEFLDQRMEQARIARKEQAAIAAKRAEAIDLGICPDCAGKIREKKGFFEVVFGGSHDFVCTDCGAKHPRPYSDTPGLF